MSRQIDVSELKNAVINNIPIAAEIEFVDVSNMSIVDRNVLVRYPIELTPVNNLPINLDNDMEDMDDMFDSFQLLYNLNEYELKQMVKTLEKQFKNNFKKNERSQIELTRLNTEMEELKNTDISDEAIKSVIKRRVYNNSVLREHYSVIIEDMNKKIEKNLNITKILNKKLDKFEKLKKFLPSEKDALCLICYESDKSVTLDCKHCLCYDCLMRITNKCPFCRRQII